MHIRSERDSFFTSYPLRPYSPDMYSGGYAGTDVKLLDRPWFLPTVAGVLLAGVITLAVWPRRKKKA